jgi:hypothetical protein
MISVFAANFMIADRFLVLQFTAPLPDMIFVAGRQSVHPPPSSNLSLFVGLFLGY